MALNYAMLDPDRNPVPLPDEITITTYDRGIELALIGPSMRYKALGSLWLTEQRFIFVSAPGSDFDSLTIPLPSILSTNFHQPTFSSNYLSFEIKPSGPLEQSKLPEGVTAELRFKDKPMFEFVAILDKTRERAIYMKRQKVEDDEGLPTYTSPVESSTVSMVGGVPVDNPPEYA